MCQSAKSHDASKDVSVPSLGDLRNTYDLPTSALCDEALSLAHGGLESSIFNHSIRVFLYADWLLEHGDRDPSTPRLAPNLALNRELLFVACILHDVGTTESCNGPQRFEVEGADCAAALLRKHAIHETSVREVWSAIALHTSPDIAERAGWLPLMVRTAVLLDFRADKRVDLNALAKQSEIEQVVPRGPIERTLANAVVKQALAKPEKAPRWSWPFVLLEAHLKDPRWDRDNPAF